MYFGIFRYFYSPDISVLVLGIVTVSEYQHQHTSSRQVTSKAASEFASPLASCKAVRKAVLKRCEFFSSKFLTLLVGGWWMFGVIDAPVKRKITRVLHIIRPSWHHPLVLVLVLVLRFLQQPPWNSYGTEQNNKPHIFNHRLSPIKTLIISIIS